MNLIQRPCTVQKSGGDLGNVVGKIYPLVEIGLTDPPKTAPTPNLPHLCNKWVYTIYSFQVFQVFFQPYSWFSCNKLTKSYSSLLVYLYNEKTEFFEGKGKKSSLFVKATMLKIYNKNKPPLPEFKCNFKKYLVPLWTSSSATMLPFYVPLASK